MGDKREIIGIDEDFLFLKKQDRDGWELWLTDLVSATLGKVAASELTIGICDIDGHYVARVDVGPAVAPIFAKPTKGEKTETFYARINNSTQELSGTELLSYQKIRWPE